MRARWALGFVFVFGACSATDEPRAAGLVEDGVDLEQAKRDMAPLVLGAEEDAHRARPDADLEKHKLFHNGIPIVNLRFHVRRLADGRRIALDDVRPPPDMEHETTARLDHDEVAAIARAKHPDLPLGDVNAVYLATHDAGAITRLTLVWQVTLRFGPGGNPRLLTIDDATGDLLHDEPASAPVNIHGRGAYFPDVTIDGSADLDQKEVSCLRDPTFPWASGSACAEVPVEPKSTLGVATYFTTADPSTFQPVSTTNGTLGTGKSPSSQTDSAGMETQAVDAHVGALRAIQFYRDNFGRTFIGSLKGDSLLVVVDPTLQNNSIAEYPWSIMRIGLRNNPAAAGKAHPDILMHEYTHLMLISEGIDNGGEARALHEGIADIFGILMQPTLAAGFFTIAGPQQPWGFPSDPSAMAGPQRMFMHPSDDLESVNAYGDRSPSGALSFEEVLGADAHDAGGLVRRWFYFATSGAAAYVPNGPNLAGSQHLPGGMHGIGVDPVARILYRTITEAKFVDTTPTIREFRDGMLDQISAQEQCSVNYKAVRDAWAAVNVGPAVDRAAPSIVGTVSQLSGTHVRVTAQASDVGDGLGPWPNAQILVNNVQVGVVVLEQASAANGTFTYTGAVNIPLGFFTASGFGPMSVKLRVVDYCGNVTIAWAGNLVIDHDGPSISEFRDETSTFAWTTNADGSMRVPPLALSSPQRTFRVIANDPAGLKTLSINTPQQQVAWNFFNTSVVAGDFPIDLSTSDPGSALWLSLTDRFDSVSSITLPSFVDRTPPSTCSVNCTQPTNTQRLSCYLSARDAQSGIFAVRLRSIAPSPQILAFSGLDQLRRDGVRSLVSDDWHWYFAERPHGPYLHGPGAAYTATLFTDPAFGAPSALPVGVYTLQVECRDFWGNTTQAAVSRTVSQPPSLTITPGPIDNQGHYSYSIHATDADGISNFFVSTAVAPPNQNFGPWVSSAESSCGPIGNLPTVCDKTIHATGTPGERVKVSVIAFDGSSASTETTLDMTLPIPPPPPPPVPTVFTEHEINCARYVGNSGNFSNANVVPATATEINGHFDAESDDLSCWGDAYKVPYTSGRLSFEMDNDALCQSDIIYPNDSSGCVNVVLEYGGAGGTVRIYGFPHQLVHSQENFPISYVIVHVWQYSPNIVGRPYKIRILR